MNICEEYVTFSCGAQVRRGNLQPNVVKVLIDGVTLRKLFTSFMNSESVSGPVRQAVMETAYSLSEKASESRNGALAFGTWLLAISEKFPPGTALEDLGGKIVSGQIPAADYISQDIQLQ